MKATVQRELLNDELLNYDLKACAVFACLIILLLAFFLCLLWPPSVLPGQVWIYSSRGNPFERVFQTNAVIAVEDGWVQYDSTYNGISRTNRQSSRISWFLIGSKRIK